MQNDEDFSYSYTPFERYRYPLEYENNAESIQTTINSCLEQAWLNSPSKNNFMPYTVHVIGEGNKDIKELIYYKCLQQQSRANGNEVKYKDLKNYENSLYPYFVPSFRNIKSASHVLLFSQRIAQADLNNAQKKLIDNGYVYEQTATQGLKKRAGEELAYLEIGIFSTIFASICLKRGIDVSHTKCIPGSLDYWTEECFNFLDSVPLLVMAVGKGKQYRRDEMSKDADLKPSFDKIIKFER